MSKSVLSWSTWRKLRTDLDISQDQLIALALLVGTDYNSAGIKGIGPKKALQLVKEHANDFDALFSAVSWSQHYDVSWKEIFRQFKEMPVTSVYPLTGGDINAPLFTPPVESIIACHRH